MPRCSKRQKVDEELAELATFPRDMKKIIIQYWFFGDWLPNTAYWQHRRLMDQCLRTIQAIGPVLDQRGLTEDDGLPDRLHDDQAREPWGGTFLIKAYWTVVRRSLPGKKPPFKYPFCNIGYHPVSRRK